MLNRLEIRLTEANNEVVSLKSLSSEALDSFLAVMSSLRSMAVSIDTNDELNFSISEGSALCSVEASRPVMNLIYSELDQAIKGESVNKEFTSNLRRIQDQISRDAYCYSFIYKCGKGKDINIHTRLINSSRISTKRTKKLFDYKLRIINGLLNQIGGKEPNYHFDYGNGDKKTIECTMDEAMSINKYLYQNVNSLIVCKEWSDPDKRTEYHHKIILSENLVKLFKPFLYNYNKEENLINKLTQLHDFVDDRFKVPDVGYEVLKCLLIGFNDKNFHLSELKTLLVISKPFKEHESIKQVREALLETYQILRQL